MKSSDRAILVGIGLLALLAGFWFMVLSPKRSDVSELNSKIGELEQSVSAQEQEAAFAESSKKKYASNYHRLVVLGKAVPSGGDTASLFVQVDQIARGSGVSFDSITLDESPPAEATTAAAQTTADQATPPSSTGGSTEATTPPSSSGESTTASAETTTTTAATATEAGAATLPIGATVGPAGLPVMPYRVELTGNFFELADFLAGLDELVGSRHGRQIVDGRLTTIDGFSLAGDKTKGFPTLNATVAITTYVTPADQGVTAGATPTEPPATTAPTAPVSTPTSSTTTTTPPTP